PGYPRRPRPHRHRPDGYRQDGGLPAVDPAPAPWSTHGSTQALIVTPTRELAQHTLAGRPARGRLPPWDLRKRRSEPKLRCWLPRRAGTIRVPRRGCVALFVSPRCSSCLASVTMSRYLGLANGSWSYCTSIYPSPVPSSDIFSATTQLAVGGDAPGPILGGPHGQEVVCRQPDLQRDGFQFAPDVRAVWHGAISPGHHG